VCVSRPSSPRLFFDYVNYDAEGVFEVQCSIFGPFFDYPATVLDEILFCLFVIGGLARAVEYCFCDFSPDDGY
jgi:hypothetical protein